MLTVTKPDIKRQVPVRAVHTPTKKSWVADNTDLFKVGDGVISKTVSAAAAFRVLRKHRRSSCEKLPVNINGTKLGHCKEEIGCIRFPGHPQPCKIYGNNYELEDLCKVERFERLLAGSFTIAELSQLSWSGVPLKLRALIWRLLCRYLPIKVEKRAFALARKRQEYWKMVKQFYNAERNECDYSIYHQIHIDMPRMNPNIPLFQQVVVQEMFERILFLWAIKHPTTGYVQGINDLVTPFFVAFLQEVIPNSQPFELFNMFTLCQDKRDEIEADSFWCLSQFLDAIQDNYVCTQPGIQKKVVQLKELICRVDNALHQHLTRHSIDYLQFSFRWFNNLLTRELPLRCIIRLWDTYLAENDSISLFQLYVCAAFLLYWRESLLRQNDFQSLMLLLQNLPTHNWTTSNIGLLVAEAYRLKVMFADAPNHLKCV